MLIVVRSLNRSNGIMLIVRQGKFIIGTVLKRLSQRGNGCIEREKGGKGERTAISKGKGGNTLNVLFRCNSV